MALLKRFLVYTIIAAGCLFFLHSLSSPSQPYDVRPTEAHPIASHPIEAQPSSPSTQDGKDAIPYGPQQSAKPPKPSQEQQEKPGQQQQAQEHKGIDWAKIPMKNPVSTDYMVALPTDKPKALPRIQHKFETEDTTAKHIRETRQGEVKKQFQKCWKNYKEHAWMHDELKPVSGGFHDPFGGWAATLIDALDTLWIMGLKEEFTSAIADVEKVDFGTTTLEHVNIFETNIRHLGGLLAAYELSGEKRLLAKAKEVGEMLYHAFDTPNHMPVTRWNMLSAAKGAPQVADSQILLAELGSFTMEFTRLSQATGDSKWYDLSDRITRLMEKQQMSTKLPGMWPMIVNTEKLDLTQDSAFTLASMSDSAYEYLPKTYALLGGVDSVYKTMYERAMETAINNTLYRPMTPEEADMLGTGAVRSQNGTTILSPELQHLSCYTGGMFALGGKLFDKESHVTIGRKLTDTCVWAYKSSPAGIMPEVSHLYKCASTKACPWDKNAYNQEVTGRAGFSKEKDPLQNIANLRLTDGFVSIDDRRYILRPEAIESVFVMYRLTGEQSWQAAAWDMWTAVNRASDTEFGNTALDDVSSQTPSRGDSMESFWMAETLKYFYLVFSTPDTISLDDYVFNTEAHPFKIPKPVE